MIHAQGSVSYDSTLAKKLHADPYGMKKYVLALLKPGKATETDKKVRDSIFRGHMANIVRLANEGKLILAGPFADNKDYEGLFLFNSDNIQEVKEWVSTDPAVKANFLDPQLIVWYGSAAIQEVQRIHAAIQKEKF